MLFGFLLAIVSLIAISASVSATETAITAVSRLAIESRAKQGDTSAKRLMILLRDKEATIAALLLANNLVNILAAALTTDLFLKLVGEAGVALATMIMTVLLVIFAEVLPKTYAIRDPETFSLRVSLPASVLVTLVRPLSYLLGLAVSRILALFGTNSVNIPRISATQRLRGMISAYRGDEVLGARRRQMLKGVLDLDQANIASVMTHRARMVSFDADKTVGDLASRFQDIAHSRLPLWEGDPDNIIGVLHARDLINQPFDLPLRTIMRDPWFVPVTASLQTQLDAFMARRVHLALVVDEYGDLQGLITLEDIVEEITGEIDDETDRIEGDRIVEDDHGVIVSGDISIGEVNRLMDWDLPLESVGTLAGLISETAASLPKEGEEIEIFGYLVEVAEMDGVRMKKLRMKRHQVSESKH